MRRLRSGLLGKAGRNAYACKLTLLPNQVLESGMMIAQVLKKTFGCLRIYSNRALPVRMTDPEKVEVLSEPHFDPWSAIVSGDFDRFERGEYLGDGDFKIAYRVVGYPQFALLITRKTIERFPVSYSARYDGLVREQGALNDLRKQGIKLTVRSYLELNRRLR